MKTTKMKNKRVFATKHKARKMSIQAKGQWKSVELDPTLFSEEGLEGLVCFEELTSYKLVDSEKALEKERKKRKLSAGGAGEEAAGAESGNDTSEPAKKKAKKKKKKKKKKAKNLSVTESVEVESVSVEETKDEAGEKGGFVDVTPKDESSTNSTATASEPEPEPAKNNKVKKKKKQRQLNEKQTGETPTANCSSGLEDVGKEKSGLSEVRNLPKKQKNWTNAALSGTCVHDADVSAWKDLFVPPEVLKALSSLGFGSPTPIQALALPSAIRDHMDILGAAETGSGKTLAFGIPMIHAILEWKKGPEEGLNVKAVEHSQVESVYLPSVQDSTNSGNTTSSRFPLEQNQEEETPSEEKNVGSVAEESQGDSDEDASEAEGCVEEKLGCVQVIDNAEFDFDAPAETEEETRGQPLLGLVLTPTRELAVQVKHHIDAIAKFTDIKTAIVVGGMAQQKQRRMLKRRPEIIIATPGRLWDLIKERHPHLLNLRQLRCLVIDEADRMVERGHFAELECLLEMLSTAHFNPKRQTFVFSATLTIVHSLPSRMLQKKKHVERRDKVELLMEKVGMKSKPKVIDLTRKEATVETLTETQIHCQKEEKDFFLYYFLLQYAGRTMVFANSIDCIKRLNSLLVILDCNPLPLHANMHQKQRLKNLERFAERESCVLLTTDVAARGLDIPDVQHVIHYQVPRTSETYVHRSGRTARATKEGLSLLLTCPDDMMNFKRIYKTLGKDEEIPMFPIESKCMDAIKERVNLARKIEKIEYYNSRQKQHNSWFIKAAEAMELDLDDDVLLGKGRDEEDDREQQRMVTGMKKQLKHLISQPVFKNLIKTKYPTQMGRLTLPRLPPAGMESALSTMSAQRQQQMSKKQGAPWQGKGKKKKMPH